MEANRLPYIFSVYNVKAKTENKTGGGQNISLIGFSSLEFKIWRRNPLAQRKLDRENYHRVL